MTGRVEVRDAPSRSREMRDWEYKTSQGSCSGLMKKIGGLGVMNRDVNQLLSWKDNFWG